MGTHPILESDFDCLTVFREWEIPFELMDLPVVREEPHSWATRLAGPATVCHWNRTRSSISFLNGMLLALLPTDFIPLKERLCSSHQDNTIAFHGMTELPGTVGDTATKLRQSDRFTSTPRLSSSSLSVDQQAANSTDLGEAKELPSYTVFHLIVLHLQQRNAIIAATCAHNRFIYYQSLSLFITMAHTVSLS